MEPGVVAAGSDGPCKKLLDAVINVVTNGSFQLLESHDGILPASALHNKAKDHADYDTRAHHAAVQIGR